MVGVNSTLCYKWFYLNCLGVGFLFQAKLCMPCVGSQIIIRKKVESKLRLLPEYKFAYLSAPAGYGKTTAVAHYLIRENIKHAWLSIDESDNDPVTFWRYLASAISRCVENSDIGSLSIDARLVASNLSAELLISILEKIHECFVIVLDDYHLIKNNTVLESVEYFIKYLPQNIKLIILSRREPENMIAAQCSRGAALHIEIEDISFSSEETAEFFSQKGLCLSEKELKIINDYTEGWVAGLVAASFSIQKGNDRDVAIQSFSGRNRDVSAILEYEVFRRWPEDIQRFLVRTSFLERLNSSICSAVTCDENSALLLKQLAESNSFTLPLDSDYNCFRYHHLFRKFLFDRFIWENDDVKRLCYKRAGEWCLTHEEVKDGINWLIKAGEYDRVLPLIMDRWFDMTRDSEFLLWKQWIDALPEAVYYNNNTTYTAYSWILSMENKVEEAEIWADKARACFERNKTRLEKEERDYLEAHVLFAEANTAFYHMNVEKVLDRMFFLSQMKLSRPVALGEMNWDEPSLLKTPYGFRGKLSMIEKCLPAVDVLISLLGNYSAYFAVIAAEFYYERNRLIEMDAVLTKHMARIIGINFPGVIVPCFIVFAKGKIARGDIEGAFEAVEDAKKLLGKKSGDVWQYYLNIFVEKLYLQTGDLQNALKLINKEKLGPYDALSANRESEYIVYARYLMHTNRFGEALILLIRLEDFAKKENRISSRIEILCLGAIAYSLIGNFGESMHTLELALAISAQEGYIRTFVDEMEPMAELLLRYQIISRSDEAFKHALYAKKLLRLVNEHKHIMQSAVHQDYRVIASGVLSSNLLSTRESQILELLVQNKSNASIADALSVSISTVKQHNSNIFDKLGVKNRHEAVIKARLLGITK